MGSHIGSIRPLHRNFGSYNKTYGTLGAIVTFLIWAWLTNIAALLGIELMTNLSRGTLEEADGGEG